MANTQKSPVLQLVVLILGLAVLGGGLAWFASQAPSAPGPAPAADRPVEAGGGETDGLIVTAKTFTEETPTVAVDVRSPHVEGIADFEAAELLNGELEHIAISTMGEFQDEVAETATPDPLGSKSTIDITFEVDHLSERFISVRYDISVYSAGAAHPNLFYKTLTWDIVGASEVRLADLFRPDAPYLERLSALAIADLERQYAAFGEGLEALSADIRAGAAPREESFGAWTMSADGLSIHFEPYQVAPYAAGPQHVTLPWSRLADILAVDGMAAFVTP